MARLTLAAFLFLCTFQYVRGNCPVGCICANNRIVCTCTVEQSSPTLGSFQGLDYISKVYIHSCAALTISADTFKGLYIEHELHIMNIDRLHLEPYAFRGMERYPAHFALKDSGVHEIGEDSFSGFTKAAHLWLKNVTIGKIKSGAFRHVSNVEYVYIRESTIGVVEDEAFSFMSSVVHFYVRGKTKIGELGSHLFRRSAIQNIMFEEVQINETSAYALSGASFFNSLQFQNCTIKETNFNRTPSALYPTENGLKAEFLTTNAENGFALTDLSNIHHVRFEDSKLTRVAAPLNVALFNVSVLYFSRTLIGRVEPLALARAKLVQSVMFDDCVIDDVASRAFQGSTGVGYVIFTNSRVAKFSEDGFIDSDMDNLVVEGCDVDLIERRAFGGLKTLNLKLIGVNVASLASFAFQATKCEYFGLENSKINKIEAKTFAGLVCDSINITDNQFNHAATSDAFGGDVAFRRATFNYNKFSCDCGSKSSTYAELLALTDEHDDSVKIGHNYCWTNRNRTYVVALNKFKKNCQSAEAPSYKLISDGSLICRKTLLWTTCRCNATVTRQSTVVISKNVIERFKQDLTSGLTIEHCSGLRFESGALSDANLSHLVVHQCGVQFDEEVLSKTTQFRSLTVRNSYVDSFSVDLFAQDSFIDSIEFLNSTVEKLRAPKTAKWRIRAKDMRFVDSRIGDVRPLFASEAQIDNFTLDNCQVKRIASGAFNESRISTLYFVGSTFVEVHLLPAPQDFFRETFVCLISNRFYCHCEMHGLKSFWAANGCESDNICVTPEHLVNNRLNDVFRENVDVSSYKSAASTMKCFDQPSADHLSSAASGHLIVPRQRRTDLLCFVFLTAVCIFR